MQVKLCLHAGSSKTKPLIVELYFANRYRIIRRVLTDNRVPLVYSVRVIPGPCVAERGVLCKLFSKNAPYCVGYRKKKKKYKNHRNREHSW